MSRSSRDFAGRLQVTRSGKAFFQPDEESQGEILVLAGDVPPALHGDRVLVRRHSSSRVEGRDTGLVIRVLERPTGTLVGTYESVPPDRLLHCDDPRYPGRIRLRGKAKLPRQPKQGDKVVAHLLAPQEDGIPRARIVEVLGSPGKQRVDMLSVLRQFDLPESFPERVMEEAEAISSRITAEDLKGRKDCRKDQVVTIDPFDAKDFDDAIHLKRRKDGNWSLRIHIADVSHYVRPGSLLDLEARKRGNSTYLVDRVIPMLPEAICNDICSLRPRTDRLTKCADFVLAPEGDVISVGFHPAIIHSRRRFTYQEALAVLQREPEGPLERMLHDAGKLAQSIRARRLRNGALDLDFPENKIHLDEAGRVIRVEQVENDISHQLIEEFMLLANEAVASRLRRDGNAAVHRIHESPDELRLKEYRQLVRGFGLECGDLTSRREVRKLLEMLAGQGAIGHHLKVEFLRSLKRARYAELPGGHYGLAKKDYTHFTSPIRRYADLIVHRCLFGPRPSIPMAQVAAHISLTERRSADAEKESQEVKLFAWLQEMVDAPDPPRFEARVADVQRFGIFVDIESLGLGGLVPSSGALGDHYDFNGVEYVPHKGGPMLGCGAVIRVRVTGVDNRSKRLRFDFADLKPRPRKPGRGRRIGPPGRRRFR